jgi:hypothetical protein
MPQEAANTHDDGSYESWIFQQFITYGFKEDGSFKGMDWLKNYLSEGQSACEKTRIQQTVNKYVDWAVSGVLRVTLGGQKLTNMVQTSQTWT